MPQARTAQRVASDGRELRTRGRKTMAKLLAAGMKVLAERGYHAARVDDVVRVARTSHGTFYLYFADKEALIRKLAEDCVGEVTEVVASLGPVAEGPAGVEELRAWLGRWAETYRRHGPVIRAWMEDHVADPGLMRVGGRAFEEITSTLSARIAAVGPRHVDPDLAALTMLAMVERVFYFVLSREIPFDDDTLIDTLAVMIHRGFFGAGR